VFSLMLSLTRYTIYIPVIGSWIAALLSMGFGMYEVLLTILTLFTGPAESEKTVKLLVTNLIEAVDLFLIGTVLYLIAIGLYELFIDENAPTPKWLEIHDLDDLKNKLVSIIVVVLGVQFLAQVLNWTGDSNLLFFGAAIAVVILALAVFMGQKSKKSYTKGTAGE
jgi:uncharacterized membrane protein YqhA